MLRSPSCASTSVPVSIAALALLLLASGAFADEGPQPGTDPIELRFGVFGAPRPFTEVVGLWAAEVAQRTGGAVQITYDHGLNQNDLLYLVQTLAYDGSIWSPTTLHPNTPLLSVTVQPGLTDDGELIAQAGLHLSRLPIMQEELAEQGVIYVAPAVIPTVGYMGRCEATSVEMLEGLPVRTFGGNTTLLEALGADARPVAQSRVWPDMNRDPSDPDFLCGGLTSWPASLDSVVFQPWLAASKPFELYATHDLGIGANGVQIIMNRSVWDSLPGWARSAMRDAAEHMPAAHYEATTENDPEIIAAFESAGVDVAPFSDVDAVRDAAEVVLADWVCALPDPGDAALALQSTKAFIAETEAIWAVEALLDAGTLDALGAARLQRKLEAAVQSGELGNVADAIQRLEGFLDRLDALVDQGELTEADAQPASDAAMRAIAALVSIPTVASSCL